MKYIIAPFYSRVMFQTLGHLPSFTKVFVGTPPNQAPEDGAQLIIVVSGEAHLSTRWDQNSCEILPKWLVFRGRNFITKMIENIIGKIMVMVNNLISCHSQIHVVGGK